MEVDEAEGEGVVERAGTWEEGVAGGLAVEERRRETTGGVEDESGEETEMM